jgi:hypothetical protein
VLSLSFPHRARATGYLFGRWLDDIHGRHRQPKWRYLFNCMSPFLGTKLPTCRLTQGGLLSIAYLKLGGNPQAYCPTSPLTRVIGSGKLFAQLLSPLGSRARTIFCTWHLATLS